MKRLLLVSLICVAIAMPAPCQAFGVFKYLWDGLANQLGLDRGPVPKTAPKKWDQDRDLQTQRYPDHVYTHKFHLQADGF
jgi:hypothetical protein